MSGEIITYLPEAATAAGFAAGVVLDRLAINHANIGREDYLSTQGVTEDEFKNHRQRLHTEPFLPPVAKQSVWEKVGRSLTAPTVPIVTAVAAGLAVAAWTNPSTERQTNVVVAAVADHNFEVGQNGSYQKINKLVAQIDQTKQLKVRILAAHNGSYNKLPANNLKKDKPWGPASMGQAVQAALSGVSTYGNAYKGTQTQNNVAPALFIATDDNAVGDIANQAKINKVPVFIANTGSNNDSTANDLRYIAKVSGGKYYAVGSNMPNVAQDVQNTVMPHTVAEAVPGSDKLAEKILSMLAIGGAFAALKARAEIRFRRNQESK